MCCTRHFTFEGSDGHQLPIEIARNPLDARAVIVA